MTHNSFKNKDRDYQLKPEHNEILIGAVKFFYE